MFRYLTPQPLAISRNSFSEIGLRLIISSLSVFIIFFNDFNFSKFVIFLFYILKWITRKSLIFEKKSKTSRNQGIQPIEKTGIDKQHTNSKKYSEEIPEIDSPVPRATRYVKKPEPLEETDRKQEIRELEKMLGLRSSKKRASAPALRELTITASIETEREGKINRIKEINRQSRPQFRISQTGST